MKKKQKKQLKKILWTKDKLNREIIAKSANFIANKINLKSTKNIKILMVEEKGIGKNYPYSGEKLSPVLTIYKAKNFNHAKEIGNKIG